MAAKNAREKTALELHEDNRKNEQKREKQQRDLKQKLLKEELITVSISPMYKKRLGANLPLTVGIESITVPVDGKSHRIPKSFAEVLKGHINQIDIEEIRSQGQWKGNKGNVSPTGPIPE